MCPRGYLWGHGHPGVDLGRGPGRSKERPVQRSKHDALMGNVIGKAIEDLYNKELWRDPENLQGALQNLVRREFTQSLSDTYIDWKRSPPRGELLDLCQKAAVNFLRTMKSQRLLGPYAKSEVDMKAWVDKYTPIAGRPDIIIRRDDTGITIVDGKNSQSPGKYTNPDQLRWYALCFYLLHDIVPDRLAFCYFRYPEGKPPSGYNAEESGPWTGMVEVKANLEDLKVLAVRARETYNAMRNELFDPTPSPKTCEFCDFQTICDARIEQKAQNARKTVPKEKDDLFEGTSGIVELGLISPASLKRNRQ